MKKQSPKDIKKRIKIPKGYKWFSATKVDGRNEIELLFIIPVGNKKKK